MMVAPSSLTTPLSLVPLRISCTVSIGRSGPDYGIIVIAIIEIDLSISIAIAIPVVASVVFVRLVADFFQISGIIGPHSVTKGVHRWTMLLCSSWSLKPSSKSRHVVSILLNNRITITKRKMMEELAQFADASARVNAKGESLMLVEFLHKKSDFDPDVENKVRVRDVRLTVGGDRQNCLRSFLLN